MFIYNFSSYFAENTELIVNSLFSICQLTQERINRWLIKINQELRNVSCNVVRIDEEKYSNISNDDVLRRHNYIPERKCECGRCENPRENEDIFFEQKENDAVVSDYNHTTQKWNSIVWYDVSRPIGYSHAIPRLYLNGR